MTSKERLKNILLSTKLGPLTLFYGVVNGRCECGLPKGKRQVREKDGSLTTKDHKPGKHPVNAGWQDSATYDHAKLEQWYAENPNANFAVVAGFSSVVLDLDVRSAEDGKPAKNGVDSLAQLEAQSGHQIPPTVTVLSGSGSGSKHLYFKTPLGFDLLAKPKGLKDAEFQKFRQAVIVPGSLHESGQYYRFAPGFSPDEIEVADIPEWLLDLMRSSSTKRKSGVAVSEDIDDVLEQLRLMGPPTGAMSPGRLRSDEVVKNKMKTVPVRKYPTDRSHSDSFWAWTLARNTCHHWDQYLRLWKESHIRRLPDTKCGRASYEASILINAFEGQTQQWKNHKKRAVEKSANPQLAMHIRKLRKHTEIPRSPIVEAVVQLHNEHLILNDSELAQLLNKSRQFNKVITRDYVKHIRSRYAHLWRKT